MSFFAKIASFLKKTPQGRTNTSGQPVPPPPAPIVQESVPIVQESVPIVQESVPIVQESVPIVQKNVHKTVEWYYPSAKRIPDPDGGKVLLKTKDNKPVGIVLHHTGTYNLQNTVDFFNKNEVDVHFLIGHDGEIVQQVACNANAAHAGESEWAGLKWLNNYYLGIEVVNIGWLTKKGDKFYDGYNREWKGKVRERNTQGQKYWEPFTDAQEKAMRDLCVWLCNEYGIDPEKIRGHYEVAPNRKNDPAGGVAVSLDELRKEISARVGK